MVHEKATFGSRKIQTHTFIHKHTAKISARHRSIKIKCENRLAKMDRLQLFTKKKRNSRALTTEPRRERKQHQQRKKSFLLRDEIFKFVAGFVISFPFYEIQNACFGLYHHTESEMHFYSGNASHKV